jgi:hypothetical protein
MSIYSTMFGSVMQRATEHTQVFDKLTAMFESRQLTPAALLGFLDAVEEQPHAKLQPTSKREEEIEQKIIVKRLRDAGPKADDTYERTFYKSEYTQAWYKNRVAVSGDSYGEGDGGDHCALCACERSLCLEQATHFGERGESPPDSVCEVCGYGFGNDYKAAHDLALHRLSGAMCKKESFRANRCTRLGLPLFDAAELEAFREIQKANEEADKKRMKAAKKGGPSKKQK